MMADDNSIGSRSSRRSSRRAPPVQKKQTQVDRERTRLATEQAFGGGGGGEAASHSSAGPRKDWRDKRPFNVAAHWAIPEKAKGKRDLEKWTAAEVEAFLTKFATTDGTLTERAKANLAKKIAFLSNSTDVDLRPLVEQKMLYDTAPVQGGASWTAHRTEQREKDCIVQHPEDCSFYIPVIGIENALQKASQMKDGMSEIQRMLALEKFTSSKKPPPPEEVDEEEGSEEETDDDEDDDDEEDSEDASYSDESA